LIAGLRPRQEPNFFSSLKPCLNWQKHHQYRVTILPAYLPWPTWAVRQK